MDAPVRGSSAGRIALSAPRDSVSCNVWEKQRSAKMHKADKSANVGNQIKIFGSRFLALAIQWKTLDREEIRCENPHL